MIMAKSDDEVIKRLDTIIGLLVENMLATGLISKGRAIEVLHYGGLGPSDIGKIVDQPTTSIGSVLSRQKKQKLRKKSK